MNEVLELHKKAKYFIEVKKIVKLNAVKISFPKKVIDNNDIKQPISTIYESEKNRLTVYKNNKIIKKVDIKECFHRVLLLTDFYGMCHDYNINDNLVVIVDENDNVLDEPFNIYNILNIKKSQKETQFATIFSHLYENKSAKSLIEEYNLEEETKILQDLIDDGGF